MRLGAFLWRNVAPPKWTDWVFGAASAGSSRSNSRASNSMASGPWQPSVRLNGDIADEVARIKQQPGPDLHVWGSSNLLQTLIKHDLVDVFWLMIYPITFGAGKRLFAGGTIPRALSLPKVDRYPRGACPNPQESA